LSRLEGLLLTEPVLVQMATTYICMQECTFLKELGLSTFMVALISKDRILEREITFVSLHEKAENDFENDSD
jgi:hypothetical protein